MSESVKSTRPDLRAERVADTEERIIAAAADLFVRLGYAATTLTAVADEARVGHRTVYLRFGTKAALLKRVADVAIVGDTAAVDLHSRDWYRQAMTASTLEERIDLMASGAAALMSRVGDILAVMLQAEHTEPLIADAVRAARAATRDATRNFFTQLRADGLLPERIDLDWLCDTASVLGHAQTYLLMRETLGWTPSRYQQWRRLTWRRLIAAAGVSE